MAEAIPVTGVRFFLALLIGAASAGVCGILIGIPVLRLKGDYLAIVTLAFGEIIKNIVNILFIGKDGNGFHFSTTDSRSLGLDAGDYQRTAGYYGNAEGFYVYDRRNSDFCNAFYRPESDSFQKRPGDHVDPR